MRAARFHEHGGPEVLRVDEIERPEVRSHRVLVEDNHLEGLND